MSFKGFDPDWVALDWSSLEHLSSRLSESGIEPGTIPESEWQIIEKTSRRLVDGQDWDGLIRLRALFNSLFACDTVMGLPVLQQLDQCAIQAARRVGNKSALAHFLWARGHNLHRQGFHQEAINAFDESAKIYSGIGDEFPALKSYYMTSLCYRALGNKGKAGQILEDVLDRTQPDDPWRANPLQVMAWLMQDEGRLTDSERLLRQILPLYEKTGDSDTLVVGVLADLGEVVGILGRAQEARDFFERSLAILSKYRGQYDRQEARVLLKYSELLMYQKDYPIALELLDRADDKAGRYGHYYDVLWQIELAKAFIFLRQGSLSKGLAKLRSVFRFRRILSLPDSLFVQHVITRYVQRMVRINVSTHSPHIKYAEKYNFR